MSLCSLYAQKLRYCHVNVILALRLAKNLTAAPPTCHRRPLFARFTPVSSPTCPSCLWTNHHKNSCSHTYLDFFYAFCSLSALSLSMEKHNRCNIWGTSFGQNFINTRIVYTGRWVDFRHGFAPKCDLRLQGYGHEKLLPAFAHFGGTDAFGFSLGKWANQEQPGLSKGMSNFY